MLTQRSEDSLKTAPLVSELAMRHTRGQGLDVALQDLTPEAPEGLCIKKN
jgi:hypothetical protein